MSHLLARNVRVEADLVDQLFNSSEKRLARLLLLMAILARREGRSVHSSLFNMVLHVTPGITKDSDGRMIGG